jgi:hypothetical protein
MKPKHLIILLVIVLLGTGALFGYKEGYFDNTEETFDNIRNSLGTYTEKIGTFFANAKDSIANIFSKNDNESSEETSPETKRGIFGGILNKEPEEEYENPSEAMIEENREQNTRPESNEQVTGQITLFFSQKYDKPTEEISVTVSEMTNDHARGYVGFLNTSAGEDEFNEPSGGLFLATRIDGNWTVIFDGSGIVVCEVIDPYNFPEDMIGECWSDATGQLEIR